MNMKLKLATFGFCGSLLFVATGCGDGGGGRRVNYRRSEPVRTRHDDRSHHQPVYRGKPNHDHNRHHDRDHHDRNDHSRYNDRDKHHSRKPVSRKKVHDRDKDKHDQEYRRPVDPD